MFRVCSTASRLPAQINQSALIALRSLNPIRSFASFPHGLDQYSFMPIPPPVNTGLVVVPQQLSYVVQRFGRFHRVLNAGLNILIPMVDRIAYVHSLKEEALTVPDQTAITLDNVTISIDGVLYLKVVDPVKASYGVANYKWAMVQLAQTTMRSELGKLTLDKTFAERENLNRNIVEALNHASEAWGVQCLRYEIRDIKPPAAVKFAMDLQAEAERKKRATILDSEGQQQAEINTANAKRQAVILQATGEAEAIRMKAEAVAKGIEVLADTIQQPGGEKAVSLRIAEQYVQAFSNLAKESTTLLLPSNASDPASFISQALSIYGKVQSQQQPQLSAPTTKSQEQQQNKQQSIGKTERVTDLF